MILKKNSWHYKLAEIGGLDEYDFNPINQGEINFCIYSRKVIKGLILGLMITTLAAIFTISIFSGVISLYEMVMAGKYIPPTDFFAAFGILIINLGLLIGILHSIKLIVNKFIFTNSPKKYKPDSFIVIAYKSFKHKICFTIQLK